MSARWTDYSAVKRAFTHRVFARYTAANSLSLTGLWVQRLAVGWLVWDLSRSGFWLGAVVFAELVPVIVIGPFGGVLADRINRVRLSLVCQCLGVVQAALLCALSAGGVSGFRSLRSGTGLFTCFIRMVMAESPSNGGRPPIISNSTTPSE